MRPRSSEARVGHLDEVKRKVAVGVDALLADALGEADGDAVADIIHGLESLSARLAPGGSGHVVRRLRAERSD